MVRTAETYPDFEGGALQYGFVLCIYYAIEIWKLKKSSLNLS